MTTLLRTVQVLKADRVTPRVRRFTLRPVDGGRLPAWSAGSHIAVAFGHGDRSWHNSYSLIGQPGETEFYQIAVRRADSSLSKGGSLHLHERVGPGDTLEIGPPVNYFPLARHAKKHLLIAGGIGITPFLAQMATLKKAGQPYELHYAFRSRREGAFCDTICDLYGPQAHYYVSEEGQRLSPSAVLAAQPLGTHVYVCGPHTLITAVTGAAAEMGWPPTHVHFEEFAPPPVSDAAPFHVHLPALDLEIKVGTRETLLEALEGAGVPIASSCRVGMCGTCEMRVLDGTPEHRDRCLSEGEMSEGKIIACVSRCRGGRLTLALPDAVPV
jgi:ferredoxin-NADP reductase